jgi:hypothetical protein
MLLRVALLAIVLSFMRASRLSARAAAATVASPTNSRVKVLPSWVVMSS